VLRYFRPESAVSVTTLASGPSRSATGIAATIVVGSIIAFAGVLIGSSAAKRLISEWLR